MFENIVASRLSAFLSAYIEGFDQSQIITSVGVWNGRLDLHNLSIRRDALISSDLPIKIISGHISHLKVVVPWVNLSQAAATFTLHGLDIALCTDFTSHSDAAVVTRHKQSILDENESMARRRRPGLDYGFVQKFLYSLLYNFHLEVRDVRIRLEDRSVSIKNPFALEFLLDSVIIQSTNSNNEPALTTASDAFAYKVVKIEGLRLIWSPLNLTDDSESDTHNIIPSLSFMSMLRLAKTSNNPSRSDSSPSPPIPRLHIQVMIESVSLYLVESISQQLSLLMTAFIAYHQSASRASLYDGHSARPNRPSVPIRGNARLWWQFAAQSWRDQQYAASWKRIRRFRQQFREYVALFKDELAQGPGDSARAAHLHTLEAQLTLDQILLMRDVAEQLLLKQEEEQAQVVANRKRLLRSNWRSFVSVFLFSPSDDLNQQVQTDSPLIDGITDGGVIVNHNSSNIAHCLFRFQIRSLHLFALDSQRTNMVEAVLVGLCGDLKLLNNESFLNLTLLQCEALDVTKETSSPLTKLIDSGPVDFNVDLDGDNDALIELRLHHNDTKTDVMFAMQPIAIVLSPVFGALIDMISPNIGSSQSISSDWWNTIATISVDIDLSSLILLIPNQDGDCGIRISIGQASLANSLDLDENSSGPSGIGFDCHILEISLNSFIVMDSDLTLLPLLDPISQLPISIDTTVVDTKLQHLSIRSSLPHIRFQCSDEQLRLLYQLLSSAVVEYELDTVPHNAISTTVEDRPAIEVDLECFSLLGRFWSSTDSYDDSLLSINMVQLRVVALNKDVIEYQFECSDAVLENCRIPATASEYSHWISIRHSFAPTHACHTDDVNSHTSVFSFNWKRDSSAIDIVDTVLIRLCTAHTACDQQTIAFLSALFNAATQSSTSPNPIGRNIIRFVQVDISILSFSFLVDQCSRCLFKSELFSVSYSSGDSCQLVSIDNIAVTDNGALAPEYANLIGKGDSSEPIILIEVVPGPADLIYTVSVQVTSIRCVLIPRFLLEISAALSSSDHSTSHDEILSGVGFTLNLTNPVLLIPYDIPDSHSKFFVVSAVQIRLGLTADDESPLHQPDTYRFEICSLEAHRVPQSSSTPSLIENFDLVLDIFNTDELNRHLNCRLSPTVISFSDAEIALLLGTASSLKPLLKVSSELPAVVYSPLNVCVILESVQVNLISSRSEPQIFVTFSLINLICYMTQSLSHQRCAVTVAQASIQHRPSLINLVQISSSSKSRSGLSLEWSRHNQEPDSVSLLITCLNFNLNDEPVGNILSNLSDYFPSNDSSHDFVISDSSHLSSDRPSSLLISVESLKYHLDGGGRDISLLFDSAISISVQFSNVFPLILQHVHCSVSTFSVILERRLAEIDGDTTDIVSSVLVLPFSFRYFLDQTETGDCNVALYFPKIDCCASVDDLVDCWELIVSGYPLTQLDGLSVQSGTTPYKITINLDEAHFQLVDDCSSMFNAPMFRASMQQSSAEITEQLTKSEPEVNCKFNLELECDSFNRSLNQWEPVIEPWNVQIEVKSGSMMNQVMISSSNILDIDFSLAAYANFNQILSTWQRLHRYRTIGSSLIRTDHQRRHCSIRNKTGSLIRVLSDSSSNTYYGIDPDKEIIFQAKHDDWNLKELLSNRRQPRDASAKSLTVIIGNGHDPESVSFDYWVPIRRVSLDSAKVGDVNVHFLKHAESGSGASDGLRKMKTSKDDLSQASSSSKTFVLSQMLSENCMVISSPVLIRNHTTANFCIRVQTSDETVIGQFFVPAGSDCHFPVWALDNALGNAISLIRPYGQITAEFAVLFSLNELQLLPERLLPSRLIHCPSRPGVDASTDYTFAMRSWTRKISSFAVGIIIEPILSIINEIPCPLYFCLESETPDQTDESITPGGITHIHHATARCRFRLTNARHWSDLVAICDPDHVGDRSILLDSGVEGSAPQPIKLEVIMVDNCCRLHIRVDYWFINRTGLDLFYGVIRSHSGKSNKFQLCAGQNPSEVVGRPRFKSSAASLRSLPVWADNAPWYAFPGPRRSEIETANPALGLVLLATDHIAPHLSWRSSCRDQAPETCSHMFTSNAGSLIGIRLSDSDWSMPFPIDSIVPLHVCFRSLRPHSSSGRDPIFRMYDVGVSCTTQASTTMVTIEPRYILHNSTRRDLQYRQVSTMERVTLSPGSECAVHRYDSRKPPHLLFRFRQFGATWSGSVAIDQVGTVAIRLLNRHNQDQSCIIRIDCTLRDATFEVNVFEDSVAVQAPYRIENFTFLTLMFAQDGADNRQERVLPYHSKEFAWDEPMKSRKVVVYAIVDGRSDSPKTLYIGAYSLDRLCSHAPVRLAGHDRVLPHSRELRVDVVAIGAVRVLRIFDSMLDQSLKITQRDPNYSFSVRLNLSAMGVSLINMKRFGYDQQRQEIAYMCVRRILVDIRRVQDLTGELRFRAGSIQIDNQSISAAYSVVLVPSVSITKDTDPFLDFSIIKSLQQSNDEFQFFPHCSLSIRPFDLRVEESFLSTVMAYTNSLLKLSGHQEMVTADTGPGSPQRALSPVRPGSRFRFDSIPAAVLTRFYCQTLSISSLYIRMSFASAPVVNFSGVNPFRVLARAAGASLANIEDVAVRLNAVHASDLFGTGSSLFIRLAHQYMVQMVREAYKLLASADVFGNPIGLLSNLARGLSDVIYLPLRGIFISKSPTAFAIGLWMGCTSLFQNLLFGFCNASAKITSSIAKGITSLAVYNDDRFVKYRQLPAAILYGTIGLVAEPFKDTSSLSQVYRGFIRGLTGFILLPLAAGFHTLAGVSDVLRSLSDMRSRPVRSRLPRHFDQGIILKKYSFFPSEVLQFASKTLTNANEFLVGFVSNPPNFVIVTSENIFIVENGNMERVITQVSIRNVFSMTTLEDQQFLNLEMVEKSVPAVVLQVGNEANARAVIKMFKYVRRRQRRIRHLQ